MTGKERKERRRKRENQRKGNENRMDEESEEVAPFAPTPTCDLSSPCHLTASAVD